MRKLIISLLAVALLVCLPLAAETAEGFGPQLRDHPEIKAAVDQLRQRPARRVQWSVLNRRFERNLAVLAERCPDLAVVGDVWRRDGAGSGGQKSTTCVSLEERLPGSKSAV